MICCIKFLETLLRIKAQCIKEIMCTINVYIQKILQFHYFSRNGALSELTKIHHRKCLTNNDKNLINLVVDKIKSISDLFYRDLII